MEQTAIMNSTESIIAEINKQRCLTYLGYGKLKLSVNYHDPKSSYIEFTYLRKVPGHTCFDFILDASQITSDSLELFQKASDDDEMFMWRNSNNGMLKFSASEEVFKLNRNQGSYIVTETQLAKRRLLFHPNYYLRVKRIFDRLYEVVKHLDENGNTPLAIEIMSAMSGNKGAKVEYSEDLDLTKIVSKNGGMVINATSGTWEIISENFYR